MRLGRRLLLLGVVCLAVALFTHAAERFQLFPGMGWGLPDSPGHYLDLVSVVLGCALLVVGTMLGFSRRLPERSARLRRIGGDER
jgi:hypothetical protein